MRVPCDFAPVDRNIRTWPFGRAAFVVSERRNHPMSERTRGEAGGPATAGNTAMAAVAAMTAATAGTAMVAAAPSALASPRTASAPRPLVRRASREATRNSACQNCHVPMSLCHCQKSACSICGLSALNCMCKLRPGSALPRPASALPCQKCSELDASLHKAQMQHQVLDRELAARRVGYAGHVARPDVLAPLRWSLGYSATAVEAPGPCVVDRWPSVRAAARRQRALRCRRRRRPARGWRLS